MIELWEYQKRAFKAINKSLERSGKALCVMACGLGKTIVAAFVAKAELPNGRILFLCHENGILEQATEEFRKILGEGITFGFFNGQKKTSEKVNVLFASFKTLRKNLTSFHPKEFNFIIVDESHHGKAPTYEEVIRYFDPGKLLGITATPNRMDGKKISNLFGKPAVNISLVEAIAKGWLVPIEYHVLTDNLDKELLQELLNGQKDLTLKKLNDTIFIKKRDDEIAKIILEHKAKTIIFCENILHAETFKTFFPNSETIHSGKSHSKNQGILKDFRNGKLQYVLVVDKFNEGIDIPPVELIVFLRSTNSEIIYLQQLGRGLRLWPGKCKIIILDFVANLDRLKMVKSFAGKIIKVKDKEERSQKGKPIHLTGELFNFVFSKEVRGLEEIVTKLGERNILYISDLPELYKFYSKKNPTSANLILANAEIEVIWKCPTCGYEKKGVVRDNFYRGKVGCPVCAHHVLIEKHSLAFVNSKLAAQYSSRNPLPANKIFATTNSIVWWQCPDCNYEWQASASSISRSIKDGKTGCPKCAGKVINETNSLKALYPNIAIQYSAKNPIPATKISPGSNKKVTWECKQCGIEWENTVACRIKYQSCPGCSGRVATPKNNLAVTHPHLLAEYDYEKNPPPEKVLAGTGKKLWWKCSLCGREWQATGDKRSRSRSGKGCPECVLKKNFNLA